jgi:hypothetical protein
LTTPDEVLSIDEVEYNAVYPEFIANELKIERERRANLESRGGTVVTQSAALSALLIAAAGFARGSGAAHLSDTGIRAVVVSTTLFMAAGVLGILVSFPYLYRQQSLTNDDTLRAMIDEHGTDPADTARRIVAYVNTRTLATLRWGDNLKVRILSWAQLAQIGALAALLIAVLGAILG